MAYIIRRHQPAVARLAYPRLIALGLNVALWIAILAGVQWCFGLAT